jgi:hypothetical protein
MKAFDTLVAAKTKEIDALTASIGLPEPRLLHHVCLPCSVRHFGVLKDGTTTRPISSTGRRS